MNRRNETSPTTEQMRNTNRSANDSSNDNLQAESLMQNRELNSGPTTDKFDVTDEPSPMVSNLEPPMQRRRMDAHHSTNTFAVDNSFPSLEQWLQRRHMSRRFSLDSRLALDSHSSMNLFDVNDEPRQTPTNPRRVRIADRNINQRQSIDARAVNAMLNDDDSDDDEPTRTPNTNVNVYATNNMYKMCIYCNVYDKHLVAHYVKSHPDCEVAVSRLSPQMANRLRLQTERFVFNSKNRKFYGLCFFCERKKSLTIYHWAQHYLMHSGELMFTCDTCDGVTFKRKTDHRNCLGHLLNVFEKYSSDLNSDGSLMGFMCKDCNFLQLHLAGIEKHLINEHGYDSVVEGSQYEKLKLVEN